MSIKPIYIWERRLFHEDGKHDEENNLVAPGFQTEQHNEL